MENILHHIKAYLYKNTFNEDSDEYLARVRTEQSLNVKSICESAVKRGGADVTASAMQHAVELFLKEMEYRLCDGYSINTGSFTATPSVKGVFHDPAEAFDPGKHTLSFRFNQGESLRKKLSTVGVDVVGVAASTICIEQATDLKSGSINKLITPQHNLRINGRKLKLTGDHPDVGVYFINQETGAHIKTELSDIITNYPKELVMMIPALETGSYLLQITTQYAKGKILKEPRTDIFDRTLYVE